ncbi:hypothetical protein FOA52_013885 [Chlamydomonas sp. UWO 241]|nr:hypothetical protein FOA52_013885 [Chlamydomonas sp. UWO 241]
MRAPVKRRRQVGGGPSSSSRVQAAAASEDETYGDGDFAPSSAEGVIMAVSAHGTTVGVASYDPINCSISVAQFADDAPPKGGAAPGALPPYPALQLAKLQLNPRVIYVSSKSDAALLDACRRPLVGSSPPAAPHAGATTTETFSVKLERAAAFHYQEAMSQLGLLQVHGMPATAVTAAERIRYLNTVIGLGETLVSSLGALLYVLQELGAGRAGEDEGDDGSSPLSSIHVHALHEMALNGCLMVDVPTLRSLQIFVDEQHPSNMGIGKSKEGFSVYGMMYNQCATNMGKRLLRTWMLRPIVNLGVINDRQSTVELLVNAPDVAVDLKGILKKMHDVPRLVQRLSDAQVKPNVKFFKMLLASLRQLMALRDAVCCLAPELASDNGPEMSGTSASTGASWSGVSISHKLLAQIPTDLQACQVLIDGVIDLQDGQDSDMLVRSGVCQELDDLKDMYYGLPDLLTHVLQEELRRVPSFLARDNSKQLWSIIYLPLCGFVVQVSGEPLTDDLLAQLPDYSLVMEGAADDGTPSVYYHSDTTQELSSSMGDVLYKISDLEGTLCSELAQRLLQHAPQLHLASAVVSELDVLMSFAACARNNNYCRPILTGDNVLYIEGGRHALAEMLVDTYIPNDTTMTESLGRVHVITGPNAAGKSCYIKQVAVITYLAHLGAWVPASRATVGVTDRIFTRLVSQESMRLQQSTFLMDLSQIVGMLNKATERSLLVVDEFGKGTTAADGVGLLAAFLNHFSSMRCPPRSLTSTHFHELFSPDVLPRNQQLAFYTMDVVSSGGACVGADAARSAAAADTEEPESIFLFRLVPGYQAPSFGLHCAKMCGVPNDVLERAREVVVAQQQGVPLQSTANGVAASAQQVALVERLQQLDLSGGEWRAAAAALLTAASAL